MNQKWYIPFLVVAMAVLGLSLDTAVVPNQEIVVQFNDNSVTTHQAQAAVAKVKKQLETLGVTNIQIVVSEKGDLKITYFSTLDVAAVRSVFSEETTLAFEVTPNQTHSPSNYPSRDAADSYEVNVTAIDYGTGDGLDFDGFVLETKSVHDRYVDPFLYVGITAATVQLHNTIENIAFKAQRDCRLYIENTSYNLPEVRAGPLA